MKASDRIIALHPSSLESVNQRMGYRIARSDATQIATEADALMAEMAECSQKVVEAVTLRALRGDNHVPSKRNQQDAIGNLRKALKHYQEYVK